MIVYVLKKYGIKNVTNESFRIFMSQDLMSISHLCESKHYRLTEFKLGLPIPFAAVMQSIAH